MRLKREIFKDPFLVEMGIRIKEIRLLRGISLIELGKICNIHFTSISKIENGFNGSKITTLKMIADVLKCDVKDFL